MLSEEQIDLLAIKHAPPVHPDYIGCDDWHEFARAIEREAYKAGQESMRERAASKAAEEAGEHGTDSDGWYICKSLSHQIEELELEEPK